MGYRLSVIGNKLCIVYLIGIVFIPAITRGQDIENIAKEKPVSLSGSLSLGSWYSHTSGIQDRRSPFSWYITGAPTLSVYGIMFPFSFTISEQQRYYSQPFNQFGVSPYYKWITLHGGYRSMYLSDYSYAGEIFLGGGIELNPGKFRFSALYGRLRKATEETTDTSLQVPNLPPTYKRMAYGVKIGVGSGVNYVDLIIFKAFDDSSSLAIKPSDITFTPADNLVVGIKSGFLLFKRITLGFDVSASALTRDLTLPDIEGNIPDELKKFDKALVVNGSTVLLTAGNASIGYTMRSFGIQFKVRRIDPGYQSLGITYVQSDLIDYTLIPSFNLLKGKIRLNASLGLRKDDLLGNKTAQTTRTIGSVNLNVNPSQKFGFTLNYANYGTTQQSGQLQLNDSIQVSMVNETYGGTFRLTGVNDRIVSSFVLFGNYNRLQDRNEFTSNFTESDSWVTNANYSLSLVKITLTVNASYSVSHFSTALQTVFSNGPVVGINKSFIDNKINLGANFNYQSRKVNDAKDGSVTQFNMNFRYAFFKKHSLSLDLLVTNNTSSNISSYTFNEQRITFRYGYTF
jgi:hypothetical protein